MQEETIDITKLIMNAINTLLETIFSSVDNSLYGLLDDITFINTDILSGSYFKDIFGTSTTNGILLISNSLILGFLLYFAIKFLLANLTITQTSHPLQFLFRLFFFAVCMNSSFFICEQLLSFNSLLSSAIRELGENLFGTSLCFSSLIDHLNSIVHIEENSLNLFSIDGLLKSILSISLLNLTFSYAIRYILIKVFILISPFAFICLCVPSTSSFFKAWFKCFISLLFVQIFVALVLLLIFSIDFSPTNMLSKILICGAIFVLIKANSYIREILGGLSTEVSSGISNIRSILKT